MSMVVLPFKEEDAAVVRANLEIAATHPRVSRVLAVAAEANELFHHLRRAAARLTSPATPVEVTVQERIGGHRPGKGDGMNTGIRRFLDHRISRLHFYDADITNLDHSWIDGAERAADQGFPIVRHYFPRASTDAMVTWMITRPLLALGHPDSLLPTIRQPLGGELLVTRPVAEQLAADELVTGRSDWGIDTIITYALAATGHPLFEHYVAGGKQHALYRSLEDLREMVHECFEAAADVGRRPTPPPAHHRVQPPGPVPAAISRRVGYDVEMTLGLLTDRWTPAEREATAALPAHITGSMLRNADGRPTFSFLDAGAWYETLVALTEAYRPEPGWRGLLFRLWVARVLAYTTSDALAGHAAAMATLEETISDYARRRLDRIRQPRSILPPPLRAGGPSPGQPTDVPGRPGEP